MRVPRSVMLAVAALTLVACGADDSTAPIQRPAASITIHAPADDLYQGDVADVRAIVRDAGGVAIPGAAVTWHVSDASRAEVAPNGTTTFLKPGAVTITATSGAVSASREFDVRQLTVLEVTLFAPRQLLAPGDVAVLGVRVQGEGGRDVIGRVVRLASDDPAIAAIDASGRLRAVGAGVTTIRATAEGVTGTARVQIAGPEAVMALSRVGDMRLPLLTDTDTVTWNGVREYHEVYIEGGRLILSGGDVPRYTLDVRYAEYLVTGPVGGRTYTLRATWRDSDFGAVQYAPGGDLLMTSEWISPLQHTASGVTGGMQVRYRLAGSDSHLDLLYRRD